MLASIDVADAVDAYAELIVVDNGSSDDTPQVLREHEARAPYPVVLIHEPRAGLSRARNAGMTAARAAVVAFTDDDCRLGPRFLQTARDVFTDGTLGFCGGRILPADPADGAYGCDERPQWIDYEPHCFLGPGQIQGACMLFTSEVIDHVGRFDVQLGAGARWRCEDIDYCQRATILGFRGAHVPELFVHHAHGRSGEVLQSHALSDAFARGGYYAKHALGGQRRHAMQVVRSLVGVADRSRRAEVRGAAAYAMRRRSQP